MKDKGIQENALYWLDSLPGRGDQDYLGFRYLRQSGRFCVLADGGANQFRVAKSLLFYSALAVSFRELNNIKDDSTLSDIQKTDWNTWFKTGHLLFSLYLRRTSFKQYDAGFTGASLKLADFDSELELGKKVQLTKYVDNFFGNNQSFGYVAQYWSGPLRHYQVLRSLQSCQLLPFAREAYLVMQKKTKWNNFSDCLKNQEILNSDFNSFKEIFEYVEMSQEEVLQIQKMILPLKKTAQDGGSPFFEIYSKSYGFLTNILPRLDFKNYENTNLGLVSLITFRTLTGKKTFFNDSEIFWQLLCSSYPFELGVVGLYRRIIELGNTVRMDVLRAKIMSDVQKTLGKSKINSSNYQDEIGKLLFTDEKSLYDLVVKIKDDDSGIYWVEGILFGLLIHEACKGIDKVQNGFVDNNLLSYGLLMGEKYYFNPHNMFENYKIDFEDFTSSFVEFCENIFNEQFRFSLRRMQEGQNAKFLSIPYKEEKKIQFEVPIDLVNEKNGILNFIDAILALWTSAKLLKNENGYYESSI